MGERGRRRAAWLAGRYRRWARGRQLVDDRQVLARAWRIVRGSRYCLVVTHGDALEARVVEPFAPDAHGRVVFGTDPASRKVDAIRQSGRCLLVYQNNRRRACVTLDCRAQVRAPEESHRFRTAWRAFWPEGPGPDFVNVVCIPTALEIWDGTAVIAPEPFGRRQVRIELTPPD